MLPINIISVIFISIGIASDNLMLSAMSGNTASAVKPGKILLILFMLLNIQMQAFMYGDWLAKSLICDEVGLGKWIALSMLIATALKMYRENKMAKSWEKSIPLGLNGFLNIALATSIYVFVLGFSMHALQVQYRYAYCISIVTLAAMLTIGWCAGKNNHTEVLSLIKKISLVIMITGIMVFLF